MIASATPISLSFSLSLFLSLSLSLSLPQCPRAYLTRPDTMATKQMKSITSSTATVMTPAAGTVDESTAMINM